MWTRFQNYWWTYASSLFETDSTNLCCNGLVYGALVHLVLRAISPLFVGLRWASSEHNRCIVSGFLSPILDQSRPLCSNIALVAWCSFFGRWIVVFRLVCLVLQYWLKKKKKKEQWIKGKQDKEYWKKGLKRYR